MHVSNEVRARVMSQHAEQQDALRMSTLEQLKDHYNASVVAVVMYHIEAVTVYNLSDNIHEVY